MAGSGTAGWEDKRNLLVVVERDRGKREGKDMWRTADWHLSKTWSHILI